MRGCAMQVFACAECNMNLLFTVRVSFVSSVGRRMLTTSERVHGNPISGRKERQDGGCTGRSTIPMSLSGHARDRTDSMFDSGLVRSRATVVRATRSDASRPFVLTRTNLPYHYC
jgi:hypothetical protein